MFEPSKSHVFHRSEQIGYWLRRAEQEAIAEIRASGEASERHAELARTYSARATTMLGEPAAGRPAAAAR